MKRRIVGRIFIGYIIVSLLAVLSFAFYAYRLARDISSTSLIRGLEIAARTATVSVAPLIADGRTPQLDALVAGMAAQGRVRLTVIDPHGVVLADSEQDPARMENHSNRPEVIQAMTGKTGTSSRFSGTIRQWMIYTAIPALRPDGGIKGVVQGLDVRGGADGPHRPRGRTIGALCLCPLCGLPSLRSRLLAHHHRAASRSHRRGGPVRGG